MSVDKNNLRENQTKPNLRVQLHYSIEVRTPEQGILVQLQRILTYIYFIYTPPYICFDVRIFTYVQRHVKECSLKHYF